MVLDTLTSETGEKEQAEAGRHLERAYAHDSAGELEQALDECEEAIGLDSSLAEAHNLRGILLEELSRPHEAIASYRRTLELDPGFADATANLAELEAEMAAEGRSVTDVTPQPRLASRLSKGKHRWRALLLGFWLLAAIACLVTRALSGPQSFLYDPNTSRQAQAMYARAFGLQPQNAVAYGSRGLAHLDKGDPQQALNDLTRAIKLDPEYAVAYHNRGLVYHELGEYDLALADLTRAIELDPGYAVAYSNRGVTHYYLGDLHAAIADYGRAIDLDAQLADAYGNRGLAFFTLGEMDLALVDYDRAIELNTQHTRVYFGRALVHGAQGALDQAIADLTTFIALEPGEALPYYARGLFYQELGEDSQAAADFRQVLKLSQDAELQSEVELLLDALDEH